MVHMGVNSDLPQKRRFPASSFELRLFLYCYTFRFEHPPLAYMYARAHLRHTRGRPWACRSTWLRYVRMTGRRDTLTHGVYVPAAIGILVL